MKSAVEEQQQAKEVPLMELLRKIPEDYRATIPFQWDENGAETGHHFIPVGKLAHKAAEELDRLRAERENGVLVPRDVAIHLETKSLEVGGKCHICERFTIGLPPLPSRARRKEMSDLSDKEIIEACARAMGMKPFLQCEHLPLGGFYNPLTDRAQAMELVIRLGMCIEPNGFPPVSWTLRGWMCTKRAWNTVTNKDLLRAICLCTAWVQLEKEKQRG